MIPTAEAPSVLAMLRRSAAQRPKVVAVKDASRELTYEELLDEVHLLASHLRSLGVRPGALVASCLPRGVAAVVTQVAVFTAGAVHVPVDPGHPDALVRQMLAGIGARLLVVERERTVIGDVRQVLFGDAAIGRASPDAGWLGWPEPAAGALAYVIHTSGSTGRPKPVAVSHGAIANSTQARLLRYGSSIGEFVYAHAMTFDLCIAVVWWTFATGGTLRMLAADPAGLLGDLVEALSTGGTTHTEITPSLYQAVLCSVDKPAPTLRMVVLGGESVPAELVEEHYRRMPDVELVNEYGPTEAAVWCAGATLRPGEDVVIGTPVLNTEVLVLDADQRVLPPGEFGELCVGGANLAEGYLGQPELTRAKFVPHPADPARRVYRTGDVGRWRADGLLEVRGRIDDQVKVRGYRIELDGVAAVLRGASGVREAVVVKRDSESLVAYVTSASEGASAAETLRAEVRRHAEKSLPEYERPSTYVVLPRMPLNSNGKIDRTALPEPPVRRPELSTAYVPATRPDELRVAAIFAELLGVDRAGLHDDFIELGGDSLLAARAAHRLGDEFAVDAPIRVVFDHPTVGRLAAWLVTAPPRSHQVADPPEPDVGDRLPFSALQYATWEEDQAAGWNIVAGPDFTLSVTYRISGPLDVAALGDAVDELVGRHAALRSSLHMRPGEGYQVIRPAKTGLLRTAGPGTEPVDLLRTEPLEPASGRVFAADLISASDLEHTLSLRAHHMISDDLSIALIERELTQLYEGFRLGRDSGLEAVPDYRAAIGQPVPAPTLADLAYWAEKCRGAKPIELIPRQRIQNATADQRTRLIPDEVADRGTRASNLVVPAAEFLSLVRANRATLQAALYAMMHALIAADTGDPEVLLHTVNAARRTPEQERTVGLFVDVVLLRQRVSAGMSFVDSLRCAADELNATYRHANADTSTLCEAVPDLLTLMSQNQWVTFEAIAPVTGLKLADCTIQRREQFQDGYEGLDYQQPVELNVIARQEGTALRLVAQYDTSFVPAHYADGLLRRMREIIVACGQDGDRPMDTVVSADPWLRALWRRPDLETECTPCL
ncbi:amino acid adenylation domain-containing protein [Catenulispora sp. MAP5-51]|uniref:non-ribosomal peptide synthetase n=1 Tax=Catenulispora sp. MAP5-51 TaxID=3156298 RepID=UPI0035112476